MTKSYIHAFLQRNCIKFIFLRYRSGGIGRYVNRPMSLVGRKDHGRRVGKNAAGCRGIFGRPFGLGAVHRGAGPSSLRSVGSSVTVSTCIIKVQRGDLRKKSIYLGRVEQIALEGAADCRADQQTSGYSQQLLW